MTIRVAGNEGKAVGRRADAANAREWKVRAGDPVAVCSGKSEDAATLLGGCVWV